ncbi:MAG: CDP-alcohol phosphatidyltransferase family protein [Planctomycetes bacterium]|nr:CDP-alcohol phosphatidyltransferase family protein [Planctomycetota bacterium]
MAIAALSTWLRAQAVWWLGWLLAAVWFGAAELPAWWFAVQTVVMALSYAVLVPILRAGRRAADVVTVARFGGLLAVIWLAAAGRPWSWFAAVAVVLLDLVDGAVARRCGGSPQGAVLDMETDQFTVLGLATLVAAAGGGGHVLLLPALRYVFVLAMWWAGAPAHEPKPVDGDNRRGRTVCACVLIALLVALWPNLPPPVGDVVTAVAVLLLAWSFAGDAGFLLAQLRGPRSRA